MLRFEKSFCTCFSGLASLMTFCLMLCLRARPEGDALPCAVHQASLPVHLRSGGSTDDGCCLMLFAPAFSGHAV